MRSDNKCCGGGLRCAALEAQALTNEQIATDAKCQLAQEQDARSAASAQVTLLNIKVGCSLNGPSTFPECSLNAL